MNFPSERPVLWEAFPYTTFHDIDNIDQISKLTKTLRICINHWLFVNSNEQSNGCLSGCMRLRFPKGVFHLYVDGCIMAADKTYLPKLIPSRGLTLWDKMASSLQRKWPGRWRRHIQIYFLKEIACILIQFSWSLFPGCWLSAFLQCQIIIWISGVNELYQLMSYTDSLSQNAWSNPISVINDAL